jgi:hypothetical protein
MFREISTETPGVVRYLHGQETPEIMNQFYQPLENMHYSHSILKLGDLELPDALLLNGLV